MIDNEQRADLGLIAVHAAAIREGGWDHMDAETAVSDVLADIAHLCDRLDLDPRGIFEHALHAHRGDYEDGAAALPFEREPEWVEQEYVSLADFFDGWKVTGPAAEVTAARVDAEWAKTDGHVVVIRHPDYANDEFVDGNVHVTDIDLGGHFDGENGFRMLDAEEAREILDEWVASRDALPEGSNGRGAIDALLTRYEDVWQDEFGAAEEARARFSVPNGPIVGTDRADGAIVTLAERPGQFRITGYDEMNDAFDLEAVDAYGPASGLPAGAAHGAAGTQQAKPALPARGIDR